MAEEHGTVINVARFSRDEWLIPAKWSSIVGWAITTKKSERSKGADSFKVVLRPEYMRKLQDQNSSILSSPYLQADSSTMEEFKKGRPLGSPSVPIRACAGKRRPRVLYRAVHDEHPGKGLWSRGFGTIKTDQISFMMLFYYHLNWKCRNASPFMSTTTDPAQAANIANWYEINGFSNVEVLVIKMDEGEWLPQSRIWDVKKTAASLCLYDVVMNKSYYDYEYLVEDCIPESCVTRIRWEEMKAEIDAETSEMGRSKKRKRSTFESDDLGNETVPSDGQSMRLWGVVKNSGRRERQPYYIRR